MTVMVNGRKKQKYFYGHTKQEVLKKISEYEEKRQNGPTFDEIADAWWEQHEPTLARNTLKSYKPAINRAKQRFDKIPVNAIKPADVNRFVQDFVRETHASQKTAKTQLMVCNLILRYAVQCGAADANVARDLSVPKNLKKERRTTASPEDIKRIKESIGCRFGLFAYFALYTGCRRGELFALTWDDIDFENKTITINKSVYSENTKPYVKAPKTAAGVRTVPLLDKLAEKLTPGTGLVFTDERNNMLTDAKFQWLWKKYTEESGVTCTPHQLRHAFTTMLDENGVSVKDAQEILGHANASTTQEIYTHLREERKKKTFDAVSKLDIQ